jgi:hypothetical protein
MIIRPAKTFILAITISFGGSVGWQVVAQTTPNICEGILKCKTTKEMIIKIAEYE